MFTGLIEEMGRVKSNLPNGDGYNLTIEADTVLTETKVGDSIAVNGACQTVTAKGVDWFTVYVSKVTAGLTSLGKMRGGTVVNLERAMLSGGRFGGHIVQGHVDGMGQVSGITKDSNGIEVKIDTQSPLMNYIVDKGSITVDGISLTVVDTYSDGFTLYLIPETVENTTIADISINTMVNIEVDILAKYVEKMLSNRFDTESSKSSNDSELMGKLMENGFV